MNVRNKRISLGLTIKEAAARCGVSPTTLRRLEMGKRVNAQTGEKILRGLFRP